MIEYRQFANILALFLIVQLAGVLLVFYLIPPAEVSAITSTASSASPDVLIYFVYAMGAAIVMLLLFRTHHGVLLFRVIEAVVIASAAFYLFAIILGSLLPSNSILPLPLSLLGAIVLIVAKNKWPGLRNFAAVIASIAVGLSLGTFFTFFAAYLLMALFAVYDYVAVFVTKHMITLGREAVNRNLAFMVGSYEVEVVPKSYLKENEEKELSRAFKKTKSETLKRLMKEGNVPMPSFSALGAGDLAMPLMLAISAYVTYLSYFLSLVVIFGAFLGLAFAMAISKKYKIALPAIPPLFAFVSIAIGASFFLAAPGAWQVYSVLFVFSIAILLLMFFTAKRQSKLGESARITRTSS